MSTMSDDIARRARFRQIDLTPWCAAAAGDLSLVDLPDGYRIMGDARRPVGPWRLRLMRGHEEAAEQWVTAAKDVPTWLQVLADLAHIDKRERLRTVYTVRGDYIEGIEDIEERT